MAIGHNAWREQEGVRRTNFRCNLASTADAGETAFKLERTPIKLYHVRRRRFQDVGKGLQHPQEACRFSAFGYRSSSPPAARGRLAADENGRSLTSLGPSESYFLSRTPPQRNLGCSWNRQVFPHSVRTRARPRRARRSFPAVKGRRRRRVIKHGKALCDSKTHGVWVHAHADQHFPRQ